MTLIKTLDTLPPTRARRPRPTHGFCVRPLHISNSSSVSISCIQSFVLREVRRICILSGSDMGPKTILHVLEAIVFFGDAARLSGGGQPRGGS